MNQVHATCPAGFFWYGGNANCSSIATDHALLVTALLETDHVPLLVILVTALIATDHAPLPTWGEVSTVIGYQPMQEGYQALARTAWSVARRVAMRRGAVSLKKSSYKKRDMASLKYGINNSKTISHHSMGMSNYKWRIMLSHHN